MLRRLLLVLQGLAVAVIVMAQATFPLVALPGVRLASKPHFSVTQFMLSRSAARIVTRPSFRPLERATSYTI